MNQKLQQLLSFIQQSGHLSDDEKNSLIKTLKEVDKEIEITNFKLDRTEKVKRTTAILLEETIEELEQKRKSVEAQNRELEIEAALARVRTRSMAMHQSGELADTASVLFQQIKELGFETWSCGFCTWAENEMAELWMAAESGGLLPPMIIPYKQETTHRDIYEAFLQKKTAHHKIWEGEALQKHYQFLQTIPSVNTAIEQLKNAGLVLPAKQCYYVGFFKQGYLLLITKEPNDALVDLSKRFALVFDLTYTRFLDLQKAEAQAREATIEASLERVRSRSMAMHKSDELKEAGELLWNELRRLDIPSLSSGYVLMDKEEKIGWTYAPNPATGKIAEPLGCLHTGTKEMLAVFTSWENKEPLSVIEMDEQKTIAHQTFVAERAINSDGTISKWITAEQLIALSPKRLFLQNFNFEEGYLMIVGGDRLNEEQVKLMLRFTKVFQQTYTRFLDLQKAEAQAKESQVQLALERVRARTMAMHQSVELNDVAALLFKQVKDLGITAWTTGFNVWSDDNNAWVDFITTPQGNVIQSYTIDATKFSAFKALSDARKRNEKFWIQHLKGDELKGVHQQLINFGNDQYKTMQETGFEFPEEQYNHFVFGTKVSLMFNTYESVPEAHDIFIRFGKVFEQTYTRFLDLQKAEAQSKEAQVQLALERARAQSMIMQHSSELDVTLRVFHEQVLKLNILSAFSFLWLPDEEKDNHIFWAAWVENNSVKSKSVSYPLDRNEPATAQCLIDWKSDKPVVSYNVPPEGVESYFAAWSELIAGVDELDPANFSEGFQYVEAFIKYGCFGVMVKHALREDQTQILVRFAIEFERAYTRFLDLKKAEAQAREAQVQLALERVRARTMAMQHSDELLDAAGLLFQQIEFLGAAAWNCGFNIWSEDKKYTTAWNGTKEGFGRPFTTNSEEDVFHRFYEADKRGEELYVKEIGGPELEQHYHYLAGVPGVGETLAELKSAGVALPTYQVFNIAYFTQGYLMFISYKPVPQLLDVFKRFAKVFEQTYTRFLDLQKAEAQAREAEIELALERVRARTMAMQHSDELAEASFLLDSQIRVLGIKTRGCAFNIYGDNKSTEWFSSETGTMPTYKTPREDVFLRYYEEGQTGKPMYVETFSGEACAAHYDYLCTLPVLGESLKKLKESGGSFPVQQTDHVTYFKYGYLLFITLEPAPEAHDIFIRFAKVFEQTYTRFLDLQKAEAQAKEAQVEAALEKIRSRSLAMHNSDELTDVMNVMFDKMTGLNVLMGTIAIQIFNEATKSCDFWVGNDLQNPALVKLPFDEKMMTGNTYMQECWEAKEMGNDIINLVDTPEKISRYFDYVFANNDETVIPPSVRSFIGQAQKHAYCLIIEKNSAIYFDSWNGRLYGEHEIMVFKRVAKVFDQAYIRFLDLKRAEAQAREAQIETALERVRSRTLAMQKSDELAETAAVLFQQLISLGIEPNRLYIAIVKDESGASEFWITDEDGTKISTAFAANLNDNASFAKMFEGWKQQKKSMVINMQGDELQSYFNHLASLGVPFKTGLTQKRRVQDIAYFGKGFIGIASPDDQPAETLLLLERFAAVFNLTFTRFNDLKIAEEHAEQAEQDLIAIKEAKQHAEAALTELQATQKQLVQSEKMASLGELTAGIAHEIQNPLNFVNNFSEVSKELLDEMKEAIDKGDTDEAKEIMHDVIQNLEKISHHGKRADGIVKGMLQHSRSSTSSKEPTDINKLADEYLRLAYHGLRAKDKSFNALLNTNFDETIGLISMVPQDIGRVILNLITNALYAVNKRQQQLPDSYQPTVSVTTKKKHHSAEIIVADNGNGIPRNIIDKIFQPFFTTKPTGQGTGLGLSLAYDIVKAHGGELKVETKEDEGTSFIIQLPSINN